MLWLLIPALAYTPPVVHPVATTAELLTALRDAADGDTVQLTSASYVLDPDDPLTIDRVLVIDGGGAALSAAASFGSQDLITVVAGGGGSVLRDLTVDGAGLNCRAVKVEAPVTLEDVRLTACASSRTGAAVHASADVTLMRVTADGHPNAQAVVRAEAGTSLVAHELVMTNNEYTALHATGRVDLVNGHFEDNVVGNAPAAVRLDGAEASSIVQSTFRGNVGAGVGVAIRLDQGAVLTSSGNVFADNESTQAGIVYLQSADTMLVSDHDLFEDNTTSSSGTIYVGDDTVVQATGLVARRNRAGSGGVFQVLGDAEVSQSVFCDNAVDGSNPQGAVLRGIRGTFSSRQNHYVGNHGPTDAGWVINGSHDATSVNDYFGRRPDPLLPYVDGTGQAVGSYVATDEASPQPFASMVVTDAVFGDALLAGGPDASCDDLDSLHPLTISPLVDAGDPNVSDPDGSRSDIGAFSGDALPACYLDEDGDGFGTELQFAIDCTGYATAEGDCDDEASTVYPEAPETGGNGVDEDCDGTETCFVDDDGDGFGSTVTVQSTDLDCGQTGQSDRSGDCDDDPAAGADIYPGQAETICNGRDDDCDATSPDQLDQDEDGESICDGDCVDNDPTIGPHVVEVPCNGRDDDCDPDTEDTPPDGDGDGVPYCDDCTENDALPCDSGDSGTFDTGAGDTGTPTGSPRDTGPSTPRDTGPTPTDPDPTDTPTGASTTKPTDEDSVDDEGLSSACGCAAPVAAPMWTGWMRRR